jgi:hypothetical protein
MDEEENFSSSSALLFAVVSFILYWLFLRPTAAAPTTGRAGANATTGTHSTSVPRRQRPRTPAAAAAAAADTNNMPSTTTVHISMSEAAAEILNECQSKPKHVAASNTIVGLGGSNVILSDSGLVAFSYTEAASVVSSTEVAATLRQERAKILSRLCQKGGNTPPPGKGSTLVVSISQADIMAKSSSSSSSSLASKAKILYDLATFYNLVVILAVDDPSSEKQPGAKTDAGTLKNELVEQLRRSSTSSDRMSLLLSESVLPSHRILLASTVTGRVALVRQLAKVAMVVDWDPEVESQLTRFGYKVALVPNWNILLE